MNAYLESWKLGLKAVAIYRDGSKRVQPLSSGSGKSDQKSAVSPAIRARQNRGEDRLPAHPPQAARGAPGDHAQVLHRRP